MIRETDPERSKEIDANTTRRLVTFGLWPAGELPPTQREVPALGELGSRVDALGYGASPPFEPFDRCSPADGYWAAVRLAALPQDLVTRALAAAAFTDPRVRSTLQARLRRASRGHHPAGCGR